MKKFFLLPLFLFSVLLFTGCSDDDDPVIKVEDIVYELDLPTLSAETEDQGDKDNPVNTWEDEWGFPYTQTTLTDKTKIFSFDCVVGSWGFYGGFEFANLTSGNYSAITKKGVKGNTYVVAGTGINNDHSTFIKFSDGENSNDIKKYTVEGLYITNSFYAYNSMLNGDGYAKKFESGDWYKLTIYNVDKSKKVEAYLADFRNGKSEIVSEWEWVDLTSLGETSGLQFELTSTDNGDYGMNTPAYFCLDGIKLVEKGE